MPSELQTHLALPRVRAVATWHERDRVWILAIFCPFCGKTHSHGGGDGLLPRGGPRVPHCLDATPRPVQYELEVEHDPERGRDDEEAP